MTDVIVANQDKGDYVYQRIEHRDAGGVAVSATERITWKPGTASANADELLGKAGQALDINAAFLALAAPTNAQNAAQIKALTREVSAVLRLLLGRLDDTAGT